MKNVPVNPNQGTLLGEVVKPSTAKRTFLLGGYRPVAHARTTDPSTSARAAESVSYRAGTAKARLLAEYRKAGSGGLTDDEAGLRAGLASGAWKRCSDLRADGAIVPIGETMGRHGTPVRVCAVEGGAHEDTSYQS